MKIGLIDVDNQNKTPNFPNIALMKLSAYHKKKGDQVEMVNPLEKYDKVYMSKVFDFTPDYNTIIKCDDIIKGGIAYDLKNELPYHIEHIMPDYSLYNITDTAYGFTSRGCPRGCDFCNASEHQGKKSLKSSDINEFWNGQKNISLLDPNILACKDKYKILDQLAETKAYIDFNQGLDIRLTTPKVIKALNKLKIKTLHTAWDNYEFKTYEKLKQFTKLYRYSNSSIMVYVLVNFNTSFAQDLDRVYKLRKLGVEPYIMVYSKSSLTKGCKILQLQRWVNNRPIWRKCEKFEDYNKLGIDKNDNQISFL